MAIQELVRKAGQKVRENGRRPSREADVVSAPQPREYISPAPETRPLSDTELRRQKRREEVARMKNSPWRKLNDRLTEFGNSTEFRLWSGATVFLYEMLIEKPNGVEETALVQVRSAKLAKKMGLKLVGRLAVYGDRPLRQEDVIRSVGGKVLMGEILPESRHLLSKAIYVYNVATEKVKPNPLNFDSYDMVEEVETVSASAYGRIWGIELFGLGMAAAAIYACGGFSITDEGRYDQELPDLHQLEFDFSVEDDSDFEEYGGDF